MEEQITSAWGWIGKEIAEFGLRWGVVVMFAFGFGGWFGKRYREMKKRVAALEAQPASQIIVQPGATYNNFRGDNGEFHVHLDGKAEVISTKPLPVRIAGRGVGHFLPGIADLTVKRREDDD